MGAHNISVYYMGVWIYEYMEYMGILQNTTTIAI